MVYLEAYNIRSSFLKRVQQLDLHFSEGNTQCLEGPGSDRVKERWVMDGWVDGRIEKGEK